MEKVKRQAIKEIVLAKMENFKLKIIFFALSREVVRERERQQKLACFWLNENI